MTQQAAPSALRPGLSAATILAGPGDRARADIDDGRGDSNPTRLEAQAARTVPGPDGRALLVPTSGCDPVDGPAGVQDDTAPAASRGRASQAGGQDVPAR